MKNHKHILDRHLSGRPYNTRGDVIEATIDPADITAIVRDLMNASAPLIMMFATDERTGVRRSFCIYYVFGISKSNDTDHGYIVLISPLADTTFTSLAREFPSLALYEREIATMFGLTAAGHPDPRTLTLHEENWPDGHYPLRKDFRWDTKVPETHTRDYTFHHIGGEGIYEIPVGPVHAGIIEPGHFRFSVAGEEIISLEPRLGWVHKGVEKLFENLPHDKKIRLSERVSGDSAFAHSLAYCLALESLTDTKVPLRAKYLRLIFAEMERLTMHIFDIGNIAGNGAGFSFMAAQGFRLVEEIRRKTEEISGSRFLRGINKPGGVSTDADPQQLDSLEKFVSRLKKDFGEIIDIADESATLFNRLSGTGVVPENVVLDYGGVGIAARSNGIARDVRIEHPYAAYDAIIPKIATTKGGDVDARFRLRVKEVFESIRLISEAIDKLPVGPVSVKSNDLPESGVGMSTVEGWRGEIAYAVTVEDGAMSRVKVRDPSFIHWQLISHMSSQDMVPDFPIINKSLNLSYSGNDL